jgi:hypothetical protein
MSNIEVAQWRDVVGLLTALNNLLLVSRLRTVPLGVVLGRKVPHGISMFLLNCAAKRSVTVETRAAAFVHPRDGHQGWNLCVSHLAIGLENF